MNTHHDKRKEIYSSNNKEETAVNKDMWHWRRRRYRDANFQYENSTFHHNDRKWNTTVKVQNDHLTSIPSVATIRKECDASISTELTTNETDTSSSHVVCNVNIQVDEIPKAVENKNVKFKKDKPIDELTEVKTDAAIRAVTN